MPGEQPAYQRVTRSITSESPWQWLNKGWADIWKDPVLSLGYGFTFVMVGFGINYLLWETGLSAWIPVAVGAFAMVGPMMAIGLYELSRCHETREPYSAASIIFVRAKSPLHIAYIGFIIMFALLVWIRIAIVLYALFVSSTYMPLTNFTEFILETPQGLMMLVVGSVVGGLIAIVIFAMTAFSVPLLLDRNSNVLDAVIASMKVVRDNPGPCFLWAWMIALLVAFGAATILVGLMLVFPLLGHATWHAYRDIFSQ
ncbi:DUF2189 domain-containing protein [Parvularcula sp. IMCC14364]|uniref:DUF2189 domain-containing protein n=1 Tax=Parvularcula sp. IMCC14364 TaxID=3067902 RepID=UPI002741D380|nr:DUF2189 domain-containing protein [Parvularcula sp. IMCC14364]